MALGPTLGAAISTWAGWRWIFLANLPFCLLIAIAIPRLVAEMREPADKPIHWPSVVILTMALGSVIEAFLLARESPLYMVLGLAMAAALFALFTKLQRHQTKPIFDPAVFASRAMTAAAILLVAVSVSYWALLVYLPPFFALAFGWTNEEAGIGLLILTLPMLVLPPIAARLTPRLGWRRLFGTALASMACGAALLMAASLAGDRSLAMALALVGMTAIGAGAACAHPQLSGVVVALMPAEAAGMASALTVVARQGGFAIGVAVLGAAIALEPTSSGFAGVFAIAAAASALGAAACALIPRNAESVGRISEA